MKPDYQNETARDLDNLRLRFNALEIRLSRLEGQLRPPNTRTAPSPYDLSRRPVSPRK